MTAVNYLHYNDVDDDGEDAEVGGQGLRRRVLVRSVRLMRGAPISCSAASRSPPSMSPVTNRQSSISVDDSGADSGLTHTHRGTD